MQLPKTWFNLYIFHNVKSLCINAWLFPGSKYRRNGETPVDRTIAHWLSCCLHWNVHKPSQMQIIQANRPCHLCHSNMATSSILFQSIYISKMRTLWPRSCAAKSDATIHVSVCVSLFIAFGLPWLASTAVRITFCSQAIVTPHCNKHSHARCRYYLVQSQQKYIRKRTPNETRKVRHERAWIGANFSFGT